MLSSISRISECPLLSAVATQNEEMVIHLRALGANTNLALGNWEDAEEFEDMQEEMERLLSLPITEKDIVEARAKVYFDFSLTRRLCRFV